MFHCLRGGDAGKSIQIGVQKRPARSGENQRLHTGCAQIAVKFFRQHLENGIVLAVYRQQPGTMCAHGVHKQAAGHHQGFFIGQINGCTRLGRGQRRHQTGSTDNGRHHRVYFAAGGHIAQRLLAKQHLGGHRSGLQAVFQCLRRRFIGHHRILRAKLLALLGQFFYLAVPG